jgi:hypothetical protein
MVQDDHAGGEDQVCVDVHEIPPHANGDEYVHRNVNMKEPGQYGSEYDADRHVGDDGCEQVADDDVYDCDILSPIAKSR